MDTEHSLEPCEICSLDPLSTPATVTRNRALFNVDKRQYIEPICEDHDTRTTTAKIRIAYQFGGVAFTADCIMQGVFLKQEVKETLPENVAQTLETELQRARDY